MDILKVIDLSKFDWNFKSSWLTFVQLHILKVIDYFINLEMVSILFLQQLAFSLH